MKNRKILIVGAGPTGLTAGVELARRGNIADIIDCKEKASTFSRAVGILPRSLEILGPSGVTERILSEGVHIKEVSIYCGRQEALRFSIEGVDPKWNSIIALAQDRTEDALHDAFVKYGGKVRYSTELTALHQDTEQVFVTTADGIKREYDYVIGADGINSAVRKALNISYNGHDLPETWSIADVDAIGWKNKETFTMCILPKGKIAVVAPLESERFRVISNTEDALKSLPLNLKVTNVRRAGTFKISIRQVDRYSKGRVFLAGDAAHCHSPAGGRGMNLGIADAAEIAERFEADTLDGYSRSRYVDGARTIADSEQIRKLVTSNNPIKRFALFSAFGLVNLFPSIKQRLAKQFLGE